MHRALRLALLALGVSPLLAPPAIACSVDSRYRVPTNLELVERADTILLGVAERTVPAADGRSLDQVLVRPVALLKGASLPAEVRIRGYFPDNPRLVYASDPRDLFNPNPGALMGACTRHTYAPGMLLLLFLERDSEGALRLAGHPFARSAEDVPSPDAPWVRAVRLYAEIAALPAAQRRGALIARRDALRASAEDGDSALLAADIDRQLKRRRIPPYD